MTPGRAPHALTRSERERLKACTKALLLEESSLRPRLGRFELLRSLGRGGRGAVYVANDLETGEMVALKTLRKPDPAAVYEFKREFRALAGIVHENLVHLHELFVEDDEWYFTMELVAGVDLVSHVRQRGANAEPVDFARLRRTFGALAAGVQAIHGAGRLHCDLKPSNVRVSERDRVVVLDYGLVMPGDEARPSPAGAQGAESWRGTPEYLAPELIAEFAPTCASDVYAMGVMLFAALTGRLPFDGATRAVLERKRSADAPRARSVEDSVPEELDELCAAMLARDPGARPSIEQILPRFGIASGPRAKPGSTQPARWPLLGRERELSALHEAAAAARAGHAVAVFVSGPSGIGKSALAEHFIAQLDSHAIVLTGRCYEREALPFKGFDGIIDALVRALERLSRTQVEALIPEHVAALLQVFPALGRAPGFDAEHHSALPANRQELRQQAFTGLKQLLERLARGRLVVLSADDLQWADLDSARLLLELLGPPAAPALLYLGCYRSEDAAHSEFLLELSARAPLDALACRSQLLALDALEQAAATELALQMLRGKIEGAELAASRIAHEANGLPLFVCELAHRALTQPLEITAVASITGLLASRLATLEPASQKALSILALAARPVTSAVLGYTLRAHERWQSGLRVLELAGLVRRDARGALVVYHDRVRELVVEKIAPAERAELHEALARAYEWAGRADAEWLIEHWLGAADVARALDYALVAAASAASKLAFNRAAALYRTALELTPASDERRRELQVLLGDTLANAGRSDEAADAFLAAAAGAADDASWSLRCRAAQARLRGADFEAGVAFVKQLLSEVGIAYPEHGFELGLRLLLREARARLFGTRGPHAQPVVSNLRRRRIEVLRAIFRELSVSDPMRGLLFHRMFFAEALRSGDAEAVFVGQTWDIYNRAFTGGSRPDARLRNAERLELLARLADGIETPYARASLLLMRASVAVFEGRYHDAEVPAAQAQALFGEQCVGALWEEAVCTGIRYTAMEIVGPIRQLCREVPALVRRATERGDRYSDSTITMAMAVALLANDQPERARELIESRSRERPLLGAVAHLLLLNRLMDCMRYAGDNRAAFERWEASWRRFLFSPYNRIDNPRVMMHHQRARCAVALTAELWDARVAAIAEREAEVVFRIGRPESPALAGATRAALAFQRGQRERARELLVGALDAAVKARILGYAASFQRQLAWISGNTRELERADAAYREQGVLRPERWVEMYAPGFALRRR